VKKGTIGEILLATDFSLCAALAAEAAMTLARRLGARVHVLHVAHGGDERAALAGLSTLGAAPGLEVVTRLATGSAADEIVRYAGENGIDLIVMGTHGRTGLAHLVRGSVAEAVTRAAPCLVLMVKEPRAPEVRGPEATAGQAPAPAGASPPPRPRQCLVCAKPAAESICAGCAQRITAEAWDRKLRELRSHP
jgi:nucleotide-binding universal stress UspA family protein